MTTQPSATGPQSEQTPLVRPIPAEHTDPVYALRLASEQAARYVSGQSGMLDLVSARAEADRYVKSYQPWLMGLFVPGPRGVMMMRKPIISHLSRAAQARGYSMEQVTVLLDRIINNPDWRESGLIDQDTWVTAITVEQYLHDLSPYHKNMVRGFFMYMDTVEAAADFAAKKKMGWSEVRDRAMAIVGEITEKVNADD